ncbi:hypothetical protein ACFY30_35605 [Streptomyces sp. NPDC000345]|uniref:hypothetical protein n=1 Tax=Streptomyces sp. NPDC000345 TaxID=3364537 RepID=UPI0036AFCF7D
MSAPAAAASPPPSWSAWPRPLRRWDRVVTLLNSRAVTVYLWHNVCIALVEALWDHLWNLVWLEENAPWLLESPWPQLPGVWLLTALCVLCLGWAEDLAAGRRPRLWPDGRTGGPRAATPRPDPSGRPDGPHTSAQNLSPGLRRR